MADTSKADTAAEIRKIVREAYCDDGASGAKEAFQVLRSLDSNDPDVFARARIAHKALCKQVRKDLRQIGTTSPTFCRLVDLLYAFLDTGAFRFEDGFWLAKTAPQQLASAVV